MVGLANNGQVCGLPRKLCHNWLIQNTSALRCIYSIVAEKPILKYFVGGLESYVFPRQLG
jgi:hypothetical protein